MCFLFVFQYRQYTIDPDHEILIFFGDFENHLPDSVSDIPPNVVALLILLTVGFV